MSSVFLSHSSANNAEAIALRDWLISQGWDDLFLDLDPERGLKAGERWQAALKQAAERCELVIFLVSPIWAASKWCLAEFLLASNLNKRIFGVIVEPTPFDDLPTELTAEWQLVDLTVGARDFEATVTLPPGDKTATVKLSGEGLNRLRIGLMQSGLDPKYFAWPPEHEPGRAPYRGLNPLEAEDAGIFFGRDGPIVIGFDMLHGLRDAPPPRHLVILGASGAGKSSFMRAGLLPRLAREDQHFLPLPVVRPERAVITGENGLVASLEQALKSASLARTRADIRAAVNASATGLAPLLTALADAKTPAQLMDGVEARKPPTFILPIDQAEELFLADGREEADAFLDTLRNLTANDAPALIALFTIRSDRYELLQTAKALEGIRQHTFSLPPMPQGSYADVIKGPAQQLKGSDRPLLIEESLVDALLSDIEEGGAKDALPLLAFTLERLYREHGGDGDLKLDEYRQLGGVKGAIEAAVEKALSAADGNAGIPRDRQARLALLRRGLIPWLAGIDPDTGAPRRSVARLSEVPEEARPLIDLLVEQRLLATDVTEDSGEVTVEPAHEALLRQWDLLRGWLVEDIALLSVLEAVKRASRDWAANDRNDAWLTHTTHRLADAERFREERPDLSSNLEPTDRDYLTACRELETSARKRARRTKVVICTLLIGIVVGLVGFYNQDFLKEQLHWYMTVRPYVQANVQPHLLTTEAELALEHGQSFRECAENCPEMIVVQAGDFLMGSPETEEDSNGNERPQHKVVIAGPFAVSKYEVTFDEWDLCVEYAGCVAAADTGFGKGHRPVINVSWVEAKQYTEWLSKVTGREYRLLSEAEWEYTTRSGTNTAYSFGSNAAEICKHANHADIEYTRTYSGQSGTDCEDGYAQTAPVGSYLPNAFGVYDMHGNVWEWVQDCYSGYEDASTNRAASSGEECKFRVLRGGAWNLIAEYHRSAYRAVGAPDSSSETYGFRVARTLLTP